MGTTIVPIESVTVPSRDALVKTLTYSNLFFALRKILPITISTTEADDFYAIEARDEYTLDHDILRAVLNGM